MKTCTTCKETKELSEFYKESKKKGYRASCRKCINTYNKKQYYSTKEKRSAVMKKWEEANKDKRKSYTAKRRAARVQAASYMTEFDKFAIEEAYTLAEQRTEETGIPWDVDHIVPLQHPEACGLHVAANIQVVPAAWNRAKNNRNMDIYIG